MLRNHNHRTRDYLRSDRVVRRKRKKNTFKLIISLFLLALFLTGLFFVSRLEALVVKNIEVEGNVEVQKEELVTLAQSYASSSWLYVFPRKNIALYPADELENNLRLNYPRFSNVSVSRDGIDSIRIKVIERQPSALWCDAVDTCYVVDDQGYIYAPKGEATVDASLIRFSGGEQGTTTPVGTIINSSSTFSDIASLLKGMKNQGLSPEEVEIRNSHEFAVKVSPGGSVIFSDIRPLSDSLDNLSTALQSPAFKATSSVVNFDYIDTRFGNKIFFKIK